MILYSLANVLDLNNH